MALKEYLAAFGIQVDDAALDTFTKKLDFVKKNVASFATVAASAFVIKKGIGIATEIAEIGDEIADTAIKLQVGTNALQEWRYVAEIAGTSAEALDGSFRKMNRTVASAADGSKESIAAFDAIGVKLTDTNDKVKSTEQVFAESIEAMTKMPDVAKRNAAAATIFGRSYSELLGIFEKGPEGIAAIRKEFAESGGLLSPELLEQAGKYDDTMKHLDLTLLGLKASIATVLLPALVWISVKLGQFSTFVGKLVKNTSILQTALVMFGAVGVKALTALAIASKATLASFLPWLLQAAVFVGIFLLVEDLITLFTGGKSVIGDFIDGLFGKGKSAEIVANVKEIASVVGNFLLGFLEWFPKGKAAWALFGAVAILWLGKIGIALYALAAPIVTMGASLVSAGVAAAIAWLPFIALAAVIVGAILGIIYVVKNWETISSNFAFFWRDAIVPIFNNAFAAISTAFVSTWTGIQNFFGGIYDWFVGKIDRMSELAGKVAGFLGFGGETGAAPAASLPPAGAVGAGTTPKTVTTNTTIAPVVNQTISGAGDPRKVAEQANRGVGGAVKEGASRAALNALVPVGGG